MNQNPFENDVQKCVETIRQNGVILYPTDTIWGLGCDAENETAIQKIFEIKKRDKQKSFVLLMTDVNQLSKYIANPLPDLETLISAFVKPTTIIYENAINLPSSVIANDGTIAVRITKDSFCRSLIKRIKKPLVSTSANLSGESSASNYSKINKEVISSVDYVVRWKQEDMNENHSSTIMKLMRDGNFMKIR